MTIQYLCTGLITSNRRNYDQVTLIEIPEQKGTFLLEAVMAGFLEDGTSISQCSRGRYYVPKGMIEWGRVLDRVPECARSTEESKLFDLIKDE